jgi:tetratricopeptide (TPR) repeat protein
VNYLDLALADLNAASRFTSKKGDVFFNQSKLIFDVATSDTTLTDKNWSVGGALAAVMQAIDEEDLPVDRQLEGDIYFYMEAFPSAYGSYMKVNESDLASSSSFYLAAKALENISGTQISDIIALLDSTIIRMGTPMPQAAAPYILERVEHKMQLFQFKEAIDDYNLYYSLVNGQVNDSFYYYREQAKSKAGDNEGALLDIQEAIKLNGTSPEYAAEEAAIYVRLQKYNEALVSIQKAIDLAPGFGACYRIQGVCYIRLNNKADACEAFDKAKGYGDPLVDRLIKEYCK